MRFLNQSITVVFFLLVNLTLIVTSCDSQRVYEDQTEFQDRSWKVTEEPRFNFTIPDTVARYNIYYNVRNSLSYPYARIFVTFHLYDSLGKELSENLVNNDLFDQKTGAPFGSSGLGDLYDHQFLLLKHHRFHARGNYSIKLDQMMRKDTLQGILAVGIRVEIEEKN
ncbi:MAG TPA: gliding motility lipoprotein GldH [Cyclobacteriaceae bacterium]|nr:gliding motility lipoprotein GldH [Cyclobacteriaceae bacterium]